MGGSQLCSESQSSLWLRQAAHYRAKCAKFLGFTLTEAARRLTCARALESEQNGFGVGQIPKMRPVRSLEIFGRSAVDVFAHESRDRPVRIDDDQGPATGGQIPADRSRQSDKVADPPAIDQLRAGDDAFRQPRHEYEGMRAL